MRNRECSQINLRIVLNCHISMPLNVHQRLHEPLTSTNVSRKSSFSISLSRNYLELLYKGVLCQWIEFKRQSEQYTREECDEAFNHRYILRRQSSRIYIYIYIRKPTNFSVYIYIYICISLVS